MKKKVFTVLFLIIITAVYIIIFRISCDLFGNLIHYFNYKIGAVSLYTIASLDFIPLLLFLETIMFLFVFKILKQKATNIMLIGLVKISYYYFVILLIYAIYFLIISYLEFYGVTGRLWFSLYSL